MQTAISPKMLNNRPRDHIECHALVLTPDAIDLYSSKDHRPTLRTRDQKKKQSISVLRNSRRIRKFRARTTLHVRKLRKHNLRRNLPRRGSAISCIDSVSSRYKLKTTSGGLQAVHNHGMYRRIAWSKQVRRWRTLELTQLRW